MIYGTTITRLRGQKVDDGYGGTRLDWSNPDRLKIPGCGMAPRVEDELAQRGRQGVIIGWTVYGPYGADVTFEDRCETPHGTFEVDGEIGRWESPLSGRKHGSTWALKRVEG